MFGRDTDIGTTIRPSVSTQRVVSVSRKRLSISLSVQAPFLRCTGGADETFHYDADTERAYAGGNLHFPPHAAAGLRYSMRQGYRRDYQQT